MGLRDDVEDDVWTWMRSFVAAPNEAYDGRFPPCPFAPHAVATPTVDVVVHESGNVRGLITDRSAELIDHPTLTTRVLVFAPRVQLSWGISEFVEQQNALLIPDDVFLNTGVTRTMPSRHAGADGAPYFIVVANRLGPVLRGSEALQRQGFYDTWPAEHFGLVVERRTRLAERYGREADA